MSCMVKKCNNCTRKISLLEYLKVAAFKDNYICPECGTCYRLPLQFLVLYSFLSIFLFRYVSKNVFGNEFYVFIIAIVAWLVHWGLLMLIIFRRSFKK